MNQSGFFSKSSVTRILVAYTIIMMMGVQLSGCNGKKDKPVQTLARVNGEEITILQFNEELSHFDLNSSANDSAVKQVLDTLINQKLLTEEAMKNRLNRTPEVMLAIERSRMQILEGAYLKQISDNLPDPSQNDILEYFKRYPDMFEKRKLFDIRQLILPVHEINHDFKRVLDRTQTLSPIINWLNSHNIRYSDENIRLTSNEFPESVATRVNKMQKGQIFLFHDGDHSFVNLILNSQAAPLNIEAASPMIHQHLRKLRSSQAIQTELSRLRSQAKIEYLNQK